MFERRKIAMIVVCAIWLGMLAGCTVYGGKKNSGWNSTGGEALERQFWADVKAKNSSELEKHMAVSWVFQTPSGPLDRAATLEHIREINISDYLLSDFKVTPNGRDMVVTYTAEVRGTLNGRPIPSAPFKAMTVWQKVERGYMAIAHVDTR